MGIVGLENRGINGRDSEPLPVEQPGQIRVPLGKDGEQIVWVDLADVPGLLISGTTGSGKTAFVQAIVLEIMQKYTPNECRFLFYDSKQIDYKPFCNSQFSFLPVCPDYLMIFDALAWVVREMQRRYDNIGDIERMPHIIVILDDCSSILHSENNVESICNILQMARSVKIHCWLVTSMPTTSVIASELKANITGRISFFVTSKQLSKAALDTEGAETLRSPGEMMYRFNLNRGRCDSFYYSESEVVRLTSQIDVLWVRDEATSPYQELQKKQRHFGFGSDECKVDENGRDEFFAQAGRFIIEKNKASIGMLQRVYKIGFNRAMRIMNQLSVAGVVGPEEGTKPRKIFMTAAQFEQFLQDGKAPVTNKQQYSVHSSAEVKLHNQVPRQRPARRAETQTVVNPQIPVINLSDQPYISGIGCDVAVASNCVIVKWNEGHSNFTVVAGALIWRIAFKKATLLGKGSVSISSKDGRVVTVMFSRKSGEAFEAFVQRLAYETGVVFELT